MTKHQSAALKWTIALLLLALVVVAWRSGWLGQLSLASLKVSQAQLRDWTDAHPLMAATAFLVVYIVVTGTSLPGAVILTLAGGARFGWIEGTVLVSFGSSVGATLAFLTSRFLFREALQARYGDRLAGFNAGIKRDGALYLFTLRLVPAVPFFLVNLMAGLTTMRARTFYWISQVGMLPGTIAYVFAGTQLARIESPGDILSPGLIAAFAALGLLPWLMRVVSGWLATRRIYRGHQKPAGFDYNLLVIGAGSAGLVSAYIGSAVHARVALVERHRMGGDCLNTGCVPSKALIRSARLIAEARHGSRYGVVDTELDFDFATVMARVQSVVTQVAPHDSVERYRGLGVEVILGEAKLVSPWEVEVDGRRISARSLIIASGARPLVPDLPGLEQVPYLTSDTLWALSELPERIVVLGGGPIGCELSQAFARFGSKVVQVEMAARLLPREDADAAAEVATRFEAEGIQVAVAHKALRIERLDGQNLLVCEHEDREVSFPFDRILLALGRRANTEGFGLEELGVRITDRGTIEADALMRTNFPNIHVCGDATGPFQFTHVASHQAWYAAVNALLAPFWSFKVDYRVIPWATFTDPEVARVGLSEDEATQRGIAHEVTRYGIDDLDRAIADSEAHGFVKVLTVPGKDRILGATIVGQHAGDLLAEFVLAMKHGIGLNKLLGTIHIYPTMAEANKYVAGACGNHAPPGATAHGEEVLHVATRQGVRDRLIDSVRSLRSLPGWVQVWVGLIAIGPYLSIGCPDTRATKEDLPVSHDHTRRIS
ncbi:MAG: FAD-dependent oxidoreductase [Ahniella sp.]|nr:FAD-dependent oxidoreductase [Ahniella sp.]